MSSVLTLFRILCFRRSLAMLSAVTLLYFEFDFRFS